MLMGKVQLLMDTMSLLIQNTRFFNKLIPNDPNVNMYAVNINGKCSTVNGYSVIVNTE